MALLYLVGFGAEQRATAQMVEEIVKDGTAGLALLQTCVKPAMHNTRLLSLDKGS